MSSSGSRATVDSKLVNGVMVVFSEERAGVGDAPGNGGGSGSERRCEERAPTATLPALEVAVAGAHGVLPGLELIAVHGDAHRAPGFTPLGAGIAEHTVEPLGLGLALDGLRARNDERAHAGRDLAAAEDGGRGAQISDARVRARPD